MIDTIILGGGQAGCEAAARLVAKGFNVLLIDNGGKTVVLDWAERQGVQVYRDTLVTYCAFGDKHQLIHFASNKFVGVQIRMCRSVIVALGDGVKTPGLDVLPKPGVFTAGGYIIPMMCQQAADSGYEAAEKVIEWLKT